nr:ATP-dependent DNA helicase PIF1-like [Tanacetum cinerariifolium]
MVDIINERMLSLLLGDENEYESSDSVCLADEDSNFDDFIYTTEFLNGLRMSGIPNHSIKLKIGQIISGGSVGTICAIPHMVISPTDTKMPFKLNRRQFPIQVCFAMNINKSQGQTLSHVDCYTYT